MTEKKKDYFSNLFNKKQPEQMRPFDENYFDLLVVGGQLHSQLISIRGIPRDSKDELKLKCQWFLISPQNDIINLTTVVGQSYQPSVDDIGYKLMVQAEPTMEGREYDGMPKSIELGPLEMDQNVQNDTNELLEAEQLTLSLILVQVTKQREGEQQIVCSSVLMKVNLKELLLQFKQDDQIIREHTKTLDAEYPQCRCVRNSTNEFYLMVDEETEYILQATDPNQRDIILVIIKSFYGKALCEGAESVTSSITGSHRGSLMAGSHRGSLMDSQLKTVTDQLEQYRNGDMHTKLEQGEDDSDQEQQSPPQKEPPTDEQQDPKIPELQLNDSPSQDAKLNPNFQSTLNQWKERANKQNPQHAESIRKQSQESNKLIEDEQPKEKTIQDPQSSKDKTIQDPQSQSQPEIKKKKKETQNVDYFMLVNENAKIKQEKESLSTQLQKEKTLNTQSLKKLQDLQDNLSTCTKNFYDMQDKCKQQELQIEQLQDQKIFFQSDINLYKGQSRELSEEITSVKEELSTFQKRMKRQTINQDLQSLKEKYGQLEMSVQQKQGEVEQAHQETSEILTKLDAQEQVLEVIQNELQHERKKYQSLYQEKGIFLMQQQQGGAYNISKNYSLQEVGGRYNYSGEKSSGSNNFDIFEGDKNQEINRLKQLISNLESTLRSLKMAYDQDVRFSVYNKHKNKASKQTNTDWKFLTNLANTLSELITEKETALENQKHINRELLKRIQIMSEQKLNQESSSL